MINSKILYGTYYFPLVASFQNDLYYITCQGDTTFFISNSTEFYAIYSLDVGGVTTLKYVTRDGTEIVVWDENREWILDEYRFIEFLQPIDIGDQQFERVKNLLTPYDTTIQGHYKWNVPFAESENKEFYLTDNNSFYSNGRAFHTIRYFYLTQELYYDDLLVYNGLADEWMQGKEYQRIDFNSNTQIPSQLYNFIVSNTTQQFEVTYIAPVLEGFQAMVDFQITDTLRVFSNEVPLTRHQYYTYNDVHYYVYSYYSDSAFENEITSLAITLTANMNVYIRLDEAEWVTHRKYTISSDMYYESFSYQNIHFTCKDVVARFDGFRVQSSKIQYRDSDTSNWVTAWELGDWVNNNYQYIELRETMVTLNLIDYIIDNGGNVAFNIEYTTNVEGQTIATKYWHDDTIRIADLPSITPPTDYTFDGWYYDSLFVSKANVNDVLVDDVHLYAKVYFPTSIDIYLFENIDVNNSIRKNPTQKAIVSGTFKVPTSIVHPSVQIEYNKLDFNYVYIPQFNRYYYVDDVIVITNALIQIECSCDVLMSFKSQLVDTYAIVSRNEDDFNPYLNDPRDTLEEGCDVTIVDATGGDNISSSDVEESFPQNIVLMGVK